MSPMAIKMIGTLELFDCAGGVVGVGVGDDD
jgi:hypothetical protein